MPSPTLQAHTRNFPFRRFPLELTIKKNVPGYSGTNLGGVRLLARTDLVRTQKQHPGRLWIQGGTGTEVLMLSRKQLDSVLFEVRNLAKENEVRLALGDQEREVRFGRGEGATARRQPAIVEIAPSGFDRISWDRGKPVYVYKLLVAPSTGRIPREKDGHLSMPMFYFGAAITYLGRREQLEGEDHYQVTWEAVAAPKSVIAGEVLHLLATIRNDGKTPWSSDGAVPVNLAYHWLDSSGGTVLFEGQRTAFAEEVEPEMAIEVMMAVRAPDSPGRYRLILDLVREKVAWFSRRGAATHELAIEVTTAELPTESQ